MDALERVIRPIVEGQIRGFLKEHPVIVEAVDWYKPRKDNAETFTSSLAKRIVRDLLCPTTRGRLVAAVFEFSAEPLPNFDCGRSSAANNASLESATGLAAAGEWP